MICELLGVPYSERSEFQRNSEILFSLQATAAEASEAMDRLYAFLRGLAADGSAGESGGLLSMLAADGTLDAEEIAGSGSCS